jgi:hypothetical protein
MILGTKLKILIFKQFGCQLSDVNFQVTGYLGRIKEDYWKKDRFYYLRDLSIN